MDRRSDGTLANFSIQDLEDAAPQLSLDVSPDPGTGTPALQKSVPRRGRGLKSEREQPGPPEERVDPDIQELLDFFEKAGEEPEPHTSDEDDGCGVALDSASISMSDYVPSVNNSDVEAAVVTASPSAVPESSGMEVEARGPVAASSSDVHAECHGHGESSRVAGPGPGDHPLGTPGRAVESASSSKARSRPESQAAGPSMFDRSVQADSFNWGPNFRLTFVNATKRPPHGCWQATCRYHAKSKFTGCKRSVQVGGVSDAKDHCKRLLMMWCLQAPLHATKKAHSAVAVSPDDVLPLEALNSRLARLQPPPAVVRTDEEIEAEQEREARAPERRGRGAPKAKTKPKPKPKPKPKSKAKAKAKAKGHPKAKAEAKSRAVPDDDADDEAGEAPNSAGEDAAGASPGESPSSSSSSSSSSSHSNSNSSNSASSGSSDSLSSD